MYSAINCSQPAAATATRPLSCAAATASNQNSSRQSQCRIEVVNSTINCGGSDVCIRFCVTKRVGSDRGQNVTTVVCCSEASNNYIIVQHKSVRNRRRQRDHIICQHCIRNCEAATNIGCATSTTLRTSTATVTASYGIFLVCERKVVSATAAHVNEQSFTRRHRNRSLNSSAITTSKCCDVCTLGTLRVNLYLGNSSRNFVRMGSIIKCKRCSCSESTNHC